MRLRPSQVLYLLVGLTLLLAATAPAALAGPDSSTTAAVSMGDSYISGEAGRWNGNSIAPIGDKDATDRACLPAGLDCQVDKSRVYGISDPGCHRSDVAEILTASLAVDERVNISCSGGQTKNIFRASSGGVGQNGEAPQGDQLLSVARSKHVKLIMVSIGGNDLGFASIIADCLTRYSTRTGPCGPSQQAMLEQRIPAARAGVEKAIDEIRAVMTEAGYENGDYRLILQTYPSVVPRAAETRYPEAGPERTTQGCPFYDADLDWARDQAAPRIGGVVKDAAAARGVETLDLLDAFQGHEICAKTTSASTPVAQPAPQVAEWGRFLGASTIQQGDLQEAFHPNAYGQRAFGTCVGKAFAQAPGRFSCSGAAGVDVTGLTLARLGRVPGVGGPEGKGDGSTPANGRTCLSRRAPVGNRNVGRVRLGLKRARLRSSPRLARLRITGRSSRRFRYCVKGGSGRVVAVFARGTKVELVATTAKGHRRRGIGPGVSTAKARRAFPRRRRVAKGLYRAGPRSRLLIRVRGGKVRYLAVASSHALAHKRLLKTYLRRAGL